MHLLVSFRCVFLTTAETLPSVLAKPSISWYNKNDLLLKRKYKKKTRNLYIQEPIKLLFEKTKSTFSDL